MAFHQTIVHGRIGKDIECNYSNSGVAVAKFSVAVSEKYNGEEKTTWYNAVAFKATAENIAKFFSKGSEIIIIGNMSFGSYEKDGVTRYTSDLIVRSFDFCGGKKQDQQQQGGGFQPSNGQGNQQQGFQAPQQQGFQAPQQQGFQNGNYQTPQQQQFQQGMQQPGGGGFQNQNNAGFQNQGNQGFSSPPEDD